MHRILLEFRFSPKSLLLMSEKKEEETPPSTETTKEEKNPLWFIHDSNIRVEGLFRSTVPSSRSGAEKMSFRSKRQTRKGQMPYLDIMSTTCGDYISSCSLKDQLQPHTRLFIEPISIPSMKHVGVRSELTDPKRSSDLLLEDDDLDEDDNIISKTKSNASKVRKLRGMIKTSVRSMYDSQRSTDDSPPRTGGRRRSPRRLASLSSSKKQTFEPSPTLESEWFSKYRKSKVVKDRKARAMLRHLRAIGSRDSF